MCNYLLFGVFNMCLKRTMRAIYHSIANDDFAIMLATFKNLAFQAVLKPKTHTNPIHCYSEHQSIRSVLIANSN